MEKMYQKSKTSIREGSYTQFIEFSSSVHAFPYCSSHIGNNEDVRICFKCEGQKKSLWNENEAIEIWNRMPTN